MNKRELKKAIKWFNTLPDLKVLYYNSSQKKFFATKYPQALEGLQPEYIRIVAQKYD